MKKIISGILAVVEWFRFVDLGALLILIFGIALGLYLIHGLIVVALMIVFNEPVSPFGFFFKPEFEQNVQKCISDKVRISVLEKTQEKLVYVQKQPEIIRLNYKIKILDTNHDAKMDKLRSPKFLDMWEKNRLRNVRELQKWMTQDLEKNQNKLVSLQEKLYGLTRQSSEGYCINTEYRHPFRNYSKKPHFVDGKYTGRKTLKYRLRSFLISEDKNYWDKLFIEKYGNKAFGEVP